MAGEATFTYDVFLSFRGVDTRRSFTSHLYAALRQRGIHTFFDMELEKGDELWPTISRVIDQSRVAIILFSQNYAFSTWCLEELTTIVDYFQKNRVRHVLPVFYEVDPSDVRRQRGSYGEAFTRHEERFKDDNDKLNRWRMALRHAAELSGFVSSQFSNESEFITLIVKQVSSMIKHQNYLYVADYPVGLESRMLQVTSLLNVETDDGVRMVGIHGIGGIGKTTIAAAVYNFISDQFEDSLFLQHVRERSARHGLVHLQDTVLSQILGDRDINLKSVNQGIWMMKRRLSRKKVLLVLDDVDKIEQLEAVAGGLDWFGSGSRVIITTRDMGLLALHGVESSYKVEELSDKEARDLLTWKAFKTDKVHPSYTELLYRAVNYFSRLPLALEVMGSYLYGRSIEQWNGALDRYKKVPPSQILEILKVSFDSLEREEKEIFLDIACFFSGQKLADIEYILCAHHGLSTKFSIEALIQKSLINIDDGRVILHDLIQDMGRDIVRRESPQMPGERSRLWFIDEVVQVLEQNEGSSTIESICLDFPKDDGPKGEEVHWNGEAFKKMKNLKTLIIKNGHFNEGPTHLPQSLRVLKWCGYPSPSLPDGFHPKKLAILELPESCLRISEPIQGFVCLTVLDFGYCEWITHIPDVTGLPNLEKLSFKHTENLIHVHESVGFLDKLKILDASSCKNLKTFPPIRMTCLEQFNLSHCPILEGFPEILGKMENITELRIIASPIRELPFSIQHFTRLRKLELQLCGMVLIPSNIVVLSELGSLCVSKSEGLQLSKIDKGENMVSKSSNMECLILSSCNISDDFLPTALTLFANVKDLNLLGNNFTVLGACFKECHLLRNLNLDDCRLLREIRGVPVKLETLSVKGCRSLKFLNLTVLPECTQGCHFLKELILDDCVFLQEIRGLLPNLDHFSAKNCTSLTSRCTSMLLDQESIEAGNKMFSLPGTKIPEWFPHRTSGESISFWFRNKFPAISICLVIGPTDEQPITVKFSPRVFINRNKQLLGNRKAYEFRIATDHIFLFDIQLLKFEDNVDLVLSDDEWNRVEVSYADHITNHEVPVRLAAKYSGIHTSGMEDIKFTNPPEETIKVNLDQNTLEGYQRVKTTTSRPQKDLTVLLSSPILTSGLVSQPTPSVERSWDDIQGETSEYLQEDGVNPTTVQNDPPTFERCEGDDNKLEAVSSSELESEDSSSNIADSDLDDPFDHVDKKLCVRADETISSETCSGDASLTSIREAIGALELLMNKDLSEISSDPTMQSQLNNLLDLLTKSSHRKVTVELKDALVQFKRKAFATFQDFQATAESVNKLKNFEKQKARIQKDTSAGKDKWKDLKNLIKKASLVMKAEKSRNNELEAEIAALKKQLATKEMDLEKVVLNANNLEAELSTTLQNCDALDEQARTLYKEADDLLAANSGVEDKGKAAEVKQNLLDLNWSTNLRSQLSKIKNSILGLSE